MVLGLLERVAVVFGIGIIEIVVAGGKYRKARQHGDAVVRRAVVGFIKIPVLRHEIDKGIVKQGSEILQGARSGRQVAFAATDFLKQQNIGINRLQKRHQRVH